MKTRVATGSYAELHITTVRSVVLSPWTRLAPETHVVLTLCGRLDLDHCPGLGVCKRSSFCLLVVEKGEITGCGTLDCSTMVRCT
jgi:hypothetical protein